MERLISLKFRVFSISTVDNLDLIAFISLTAKRIFGLLDIGLWDLKTYLGYLGSLGTLGLPQLLMGIV
jgi:hypothetical protein